MIDEILKHLKNEIERWKTINPIWEPGSDRAKWALDRRRHEAAVGGCVIWSTRDFLGHPVLPVDTQRTMRALARMETAGLVALFRENGRLSRVKLTAAGMTIASRVQP